MKLSIIICVYNTDKAFLEECLSSVTSSTLTDYEIVFVDDGSTVDYSDIVAKYKVKYSKTENRGHFAARLYGIEKAEGEYVTFVDSDDTVSQNYHQPMVLAAEKYGADIVINSWAFRTDRTTRCCTYELTTAKKVCVTGEEVPLFFTSNRGKDHSYFVQWNKIFRRSTIKSAIEELSKTEIFKKRLTYAEDALLSFFYFKHAKKVISVNSGFYFYRIHSLQSVVPTDKNKLKSHIECMTSVFDTMISYLPEGKYTDQMRENILFWKGLMARTHYSSARSAGFSDLYPIIKEKYGIDKLRISKFSDGKVYSRAELLGVNFKDIDNALSEIYLSKSDVTVNYDTSSKCVSRIIDFLSDVTDKKITYRKKGAKITVPKAKNKLIDRIIHNIFVYRIGLVLFRKGSKTRNFLKRHL